MTGPLAVDVEIFPPGPRRPDIDSLQRAFVDALQHGGAYLHDNQIVRLSIVKREPIERVKSLVFIRKERC